MIHRLSHSEENPFSVNRHSLHDYPRAALLFAAPVLSGLGFSFALARPAINGLPNDFEPTLAQLLEIYDRAKRGLQWRVELLAIGSIMRTTFICSPMV
jgi:hypothetical protein